MGMVTAQAVGVALIVASAPCCDAADTVSVSIAQVPSQVEVSPASVGLYVGGTSQLSATVMDQNGYPIPDATVQWISSAPSVADVDQSGASGEATVLALVAGSATIRAESGSASGEVGVSVSDSPPPQEGILFSDGFESADFSGPGEGFDWRSPNRTSIVRDDGYVVNNGSPVMIGPLPAKQWENGPDSGGRHSMRFYYPAGQNMAEQRFTLPDPLPELWVSFWWRVPINFSHPGGNNNQKLLALWMDAYEFRGEGPTVVWQFRGNASGGSGITLYHVATDEGQSGRHSGESGGGSLIVTPDDRGRWMHLVFRVVASTDPENPNGIIQTWRRWEDEASYTQLFDVSNAMTHPPAGTQGFRAGYLMGWANAPYPETTEFLIDDVVFSTGSLIH